MLCSGVMCHANHILQNFIIYGSISKSKDSSKIKTLKSIRGKRKSNKSFTCLNRNSL